MFSMHNVSLCGWQLEKNKKHAASDARGGCGTREGRQRANTIECKLAILYFHLCKCNPLVEKKKTFCSFSRLSIYQLALNIRIYRLPPAEDYELHNPRSVSFSKQMAYQQGLPLLLNGYAILTPQHGIISLDASIRVNEAKVNQLSF